jgi:hypothetical protein|tara:strand:+ start:4077 stop:5060 length:984 start_codon:yes stop_codon:yes gene_type:complete
MLSKKILLFITLTTFIFCSGKVGTSIFRWAEIETGTRAVAMAGSQVASGNGVYSTPYNPASLGFIKNSELFVSKSSYLAGTSHNTIAYGTKVTPSDFVGIHLYYFDSGTMNETTEAVGGETGQTFKYTGLVVRATYARQLTDRLKLGANFKYLKEQTTSADLSMSSMGFDIGSNFDTGIYGMVLGMCISNFGADGRYIGNGLDLNDGENEDLQKETGYYPMPLTFRVGFMNNLVGPSESSAIRNENHRVTISWDAINPLDYDLYSSLGAEYSWNEMLFGRLGMHLGHDTAGFSMGGGIIYNNIILDFAFSDYGILESAMQAGLSFRF